MSGVDPSRLADNYQPDFGLDWVPVLSRERLREMNDKELWEYSRARKYAEEQAVKNPVGSGWVLPSWRKVMSAWRTHPIQIILGGVRCVRGDTPIYDPIANDTQSIAKRAGKPFHVLAWNGRDLVPATVPNGSFQKGMGRMVKIKWRSPTKGDIQHGKWLVCTESHRIMGAGGGWHHAGALQVGSAILAPWTKEGFMEVASVTPLEREYVVWDMSVPFFQNYWAAGAIHHNSSKSSLASRLCVWGLGNIPECEIRCYHVNKDRSKQDQQRFIWDALPEGIKGLPTSRGKYHSIQWTQANGFTNNTLILPPLEGHRRGGRIDFSNYASFIDDPRTAEGFKAQIIWCIAEGELVQMADGTLKPIERVRVGDEVLSATVDGRMEARKVLAAQCTGEKECVRLRTRNGTPVVCTPDHEVYFDYRGNSKVVASEAKYVAQKPSGDWSRKTEDREEGWYVWAALITSEGCAASQKITSGSVDLLASAVNLLPKGASVRRQDFAVRHKHVPDWYLNWPEMWDFFSGSCSSNITIPDWVFTSSLDRIRLFLRWLYLGDGWASGHSIGYATTSYRLSIQIVALLNRFGVKASWQVRPAKGNWKEQYWVVVSKASAVIKFADEIGIEGKQAAVDRVRSEAARRVASSHARTEKCLGRKTRLVGHAEKLSAKKSRLTDRNSVGLRRVYDLTVEGEHRFFVGTALVSNCDEEIPVRLFETLTYRTTDYHGRILLTFTTLDGWTPLVQDILGKTKTLEWRYSPLVKRKLPVLQESLSRPGALIHYFWTMDNPFIDGNEFLLKLKGRSEDEILARAHGIPTKAAKAVFTKFDRLVHVVPHEELPFVKNPNYPVTRYMIMDPGGSKNDFIGWVAVDAFGTLWCYREWPDYNTYGAWAEPGSTPEGKAGPAQRSLGFGIREMAELILSLENGEQIFERLIDPRMGAAERKGDEGATTLISDYDKYDITMIPAPGLELEHGIRHITGLLNWNAEKPRDSKNSPRLYFSDRCENWIHMMAEWTNYCRTEHTKEGPDILRYLTTSTAIHCDPASMKTQGRTGSY